MIPKNRGENFFSGFLHLEFFRRDPNNFQSRLVTVNETWLYHYDPETKQQSMEGKHSGSPGPKYSECKNLLEKFQLRFFGIKTPSSSLIIFQMAKLSSRSITDLCLQLKDILKEKRHGKVTKGVLFLHDNVPAHRHLQRRRNWPTWASSVLITHPILQIWPRRTTTCSLD